MKEGKIGFWIRKSQNFTPKLKDNTGVQVKACGSPITPHHGKDSSNNRTKYFDQGTRKDQTFLHSFTFGAEPD